MSKVQTYSINGQQYEVTETKAGRVPADLANKEGVAYWWDGDSWVRVEFLKGADGRYRRGIPS